MSPSNRGRPPAFERDQAILGAARLFWRYGYSGTSTRALTAGLGLSTSSLYSAFGSKAGLFEEAVRNYAEHYREIYRQAVAERDIADVIERVLLDSVLEFTQDTDSHPGCLISSAAMADTTDTLDTKAYIADLQDSNAEALRARIDEAIRDGQLSSGTDPGALTGLIQAVWHGLSAQSNLGVTRQELLETARLAHGLIVQRLAPHAG
ncbi:TetR/AcrR family transcriptional regulator [Arthrobacter sp. NPDC090010]|uniref:TetR/AcrR family transcriptional regulator n=1 Tax=Arthrobacter sp. NPDC090010 TaxID=3363942 RepID=UPI0038160554